MIRWLLIVACFFSPTWAQAATLNDGFGDALKLNSQHFTIYYKKSVDLATLSSQLNITPTDQLLTNQTIDDSSLPGQISSMLDILFNRACDVLDMHVYSFKGNIKIFATQQDLQDFFKGMYHKDLPCTGVSFYIYDLNSIYISAENFRREVLGHEMGHAVISNYFVVQPSMKIQEVLAGYVEYQLRKGK